METIYTRLTVCFDSPFWVGVFERETQTGYAACKVTFGAEPKDQEIYAFLLRNFNKLRFTEQTMDGAAAGKRKNPKRIRREIRRQMERRTGMGTKAQQAIQQQREQNKTEQKSQRRAKRCEREERLFRLRVQKRKEKHKGH